MNSYTASINGDRVRSVHPHMDIPIRTPVAISAPVSEAVALIQVIERAALNPNVDIDKMERLIEMQERVMARNSKGAYAAALASMQAELPVIAERGKIIVRDKSNQEKIIQSTSYALWEDINEAIKPALAEHGFALSFRTGIAPDGKLTVTGILSHRDGHSEETTMALPHDSTGSKNAVQAVGSSTSYGKRYTASALLNITSRGEDDDGSAAIAATSISDDQVAELDRLIKTVGADKARFLAYLQVERLDALPAKKFDSAVTILNAKGARS